MWVWPAQSLAYPTVDPSNDPLRARIVVAPASRLHVRPAACAHARCGLQADEELHPGPSAANSALYSAGDERNARFSLSSTLDFAGLQPIIIRALTRRKRGAVQRLPEHLGPARQSRS